MLRKRRQPGAVRYLEREVAGTNSTQRSKQSVSLRSNIWLLQSNFGGTGDASVKEKSDMQPSKISSPSKRWLRGSVARFSETHSEKAYDSSSVTEAGSVISVREEQKEKAFEPICVTFDGIVTEASEVQYANACDPMSVSREGSDTVCSDWHQLNTAFGNFSIRAGTVNLDRFEHSLKHPSPNAVTETGSSIFRRFPQPRKAYSPIDRSVEPVSNLTVWKSFLS